MIIYIWACSECDSRTIVERPYYKDLKVDDALPWGWVWSEGRPYCPLCAEGKGLR